MKLVLIEWIDSHSGRGWQSLDEIKQCARLLYCRSVGWLVSENKDCKVLAPHISGEKNGDIELHGCGDLTIPKKSILKTTVLRNA